MPDFALCLQGFGFEFRPGQTMDIKTDTCCLPHTQYDGFGARESGNNQRFELHHFYSSVLSGSP